MKILVTGGTGVTGKALVRRLLQNGHHVVVLDIKEGYKTFELRESGAEIVLGSVMDAHVVDTCMNGVDIVHHLATAFREMHLSRKEYRQVEVEGTRIVGEAALRHGVKKFVYCSTCGVHGNVENPPAAEDAPIRPADDYQLAKYEAEPVTLELFEKGLPATILRPNAIYGPGDPGRFFMLFKRVASGVFPILGSGKTLYHPLYIDNLVDAFLLAQEPNKGVGEAYLIADEEYVEIEDLVRRVAQAMGVAVKMPHLPLWPVLALAHVLEAGCKPLKVSPPIFPRRVSWYRQNRAFDIAKAKRELGYRPEVRLDEGLALTYEWYKAEGLL